MDTRKGRSRTISKCTISLSETDPLARLEEFCNQAKYQFKINWDRYKNGFMCECLIYYRLGKNNRNLKKEVQWIQTDSIQDAKKTIAAICLDSLGLGVPEENSDEASDPSRILMEMGLKAVNGLKSWADIVEEEN